MALDEPNDADLTFAHEGFTLVVERQLIDAVGGVAIDYVENSRGLGFELRTTRPMGGCDHGSCGPGCH
jgi:Fe-S cluster assembly iron-binding protein IscA